MRGRSDVEKSITYTYNKIEERAARSHEENGKRIAYKENRYYGETKKSKRGKTKNTVLNK